MIEHPDVPVEYVRYLEQLYTAFEAVLGPINLVPSTRHGIPGDYAFNQLFRVSAKDEHPQGEYCIRYQRRSLELVWFSGIVPTRAGSFVSRFVALRQWLAMRRSEDARLELRPPTKAVEAAITAVTKYVQEVRGAS